MRPCASRAVMRGRRQVRPAGSHTARSTANGSLLRRPGHGAAFQIHRERAAALPGMPLRRRVARCPAAEQQPAGARPAGLQAPGRRPSARPRHRRPPAGTTMAPAARSGDRPPASPKLTSALTPSGKPGGRRAAPAASPPPTATVPPRPRASRASAARPTTMPSMARSRRRPGGVALHEVAVARQRQQREEQAVAVVAQVEHAREADGGVGLLVPFAVAPLRAAQVVDALRHRRVVHLARRHQAQQRPGGLRRRALLVRPGGASA